MSVRFILGRAGSGKTHRCVQAIRERLSSDPWEGPRLLLLVPEQAALQMERAIVAPSVSQVDMQGTASFETVAVHRAEVLSFRRLAARVLDSTGTSEEPVLSEPARAMVLRHLFDRNRDQLRYYRRAGHLSGLFDRLSATVAEWMEESISPEQLAKALTQVRPTDLVPSAKGHDLSLLYTAYCDYLGGGRRDPSRRLEFIRRLLPRCDWLIGAELWVDGFAALSGEESRTLVALCQACANAEITVMLDPAAEGAAGAAGAAGGLFTKTAQTYRVLRQRLEEAGVPLDDSVVLGAEPPPRFRRQPALAALERTLFRERPASPTDSPDFGAAVECVRLPTRRWEAAYAVSRVCEWIQEGEGIRRYRHAAIIARDLRPYQDDLRAALEERRIPYFIDQRRSIAHHPLVEFLRAALRMGKDDVSLDAVRLLLKTGLVPLAAGASDVLENYILARGIQGATQWQSEWKQPLRPPAERGAAGEVTPGERDQLRAVNEARAALWGRLESWMVFATASRPRNGGEWADRLRELLRSFDIGVTLTRWEEESEASGRLNEADQHRQVRRDVLSFLDQLAAAFATTALNVGELGDVVESGLSGLTVGLAPPMVDQVLIGSIDRSRHPDLKAVVIVGLNEGVFPQHPAEDSIVNDDDRAALAEADVPVRPPARSRVLDERLLFYTALTRASDTVVVTYAAADESGRALRPSTYVKALRAACPNLSIKDVSDPVAARATWPIWTVGTLGRRLLGEFRTRPPLERDDPAVRGTWNRLYEAFRGDLDHEESWRTARRALVPPSPERISSRATARLIPGELQTSVSRLETYAACPFQYFARYVLKLQERAVAPWAEVDFGRIHHAVLEDFIGGILGRREGLRELDDEELMGRLQGSWNRVEAQLADGEFASSARDAYLLRRSAEQLGRVLRAQKSLAGQGTAHPYAVEVPFGFSVPGSLPRLSIKTPAGRTIALRGYIDRVDLAELGDELLGLVIDYKSTRKKQLSLAEVYHGLSLQLLAYLLVLSEHGRTPAGRRIRPAGALYLALSPRYRLLEHPSDLGDPRDQELEAYRPRGILDIQASPAFDQAQRSSWSKAFSIYHGKNPDDVGYVDRSDAVNATGLAALLEHTRTVLGRHADGILDGDFTVRPYQLGGFRPCSWCAMAAVCRFEIGLHDVRSLDPLKRSQVLARLTQERPAEQDDWS